MVSFALSVALMVSSGGLLAERTPLAGSLVGLTDLNAQSSMYDNMTVDELTAERARVAGLMPSLGLGIALTAVGGGVLLTGLFLIAASEFIIEMVIVGVVMVAASIPLLIIGPILLAGAARERREVQTQLRLIDQRIASLRREDVPSSPPAPEYDPKAEPPPPPPVRPPSSQFAPNVTPQLVLAAF